MLCLCVKAYICARASVYVCVRVCVCVHRRKCTNTFPPYKLRHYTFRTTTVSLSHTNSAAMRCGVRAVLSFERHANLHEYTTITRSISRVILYPLYATRLQSVFQRNYVVVT